MAYEELIASMERDAERRIQEVRQQAEAAINEEREFVRRQAEELRRRIQREGEARIEVERHQRLYRAREEERAAFARLRGEYERQVIDAAGERLAQLRGSDRYSSIMERLLLEAVASLGEPGGRVHVDPRDEALALGILARSLPGVELVADISTMGGAVVTSSDDRIRIDNTFEARLVRASEDFRRELARRLFGGE
ncbi:MAG TPA: V-type ATP synthase subunit E [Methanoregulaceae archaeon]|nr:V-type ATP synthase subunit E [Methanoregulaceae archaeon]HQJ88582.1 V-type ATP synthase subunit E [Methanoregulaceae archaeon]